MYDTFICWVEEYEIKKPICKYARQKPLYKIFRKFSEQLHNERHKRYRNIYFECEKPRIAKTLVIKCSNLNLFGIVAEPEDQIEEEKGSDDSMNEFEDLISINQAFQKFR